MVLIQNASTFLAEKFKNTFLFFSILFISCGNNSKVVSQQKNSDTSKPNQQLVQTKDSLTIGANQTELYLPLLQHKKVAIVGNQTSVIFKKGAVTSDSLTEHTLLHTHLVDSLVSNGINVVKVFAPEHGFRGTADAGELVKNGKDIKTGIPIISLYGKNKKPSSEALQDVDIMVFDIQDVGVRFYTYISTLHYVMQSCAENNIPLLILDRPNPNGHYIDGPTLEIAHQSFVGMHPIPLVHGMTIGEYAKMVNGEGWLGNDLKCEITVIPIKNYTHNTFYSPPIRPSPNLPNDTSINLYPSLGFFEGTSINAGRGTEMQFQIFGSPDLPKETYDFTYIPQPNFGAKHPKHQGKSCNGKDLRATQRMNHVDLSWLIEAYVNSTKKSNFFNSDSFTIHAGTKKLQLQIEQGYSFKEIRKTWLQDLENFKKIRANYLLYP
ncbi:exo-beta-N-acetylmuramidase NamZ family protein [Aquimarina brevivitae]|uniref:Uncharacterized protein YbbC (DUF1343 family) n=1 Tax=Aquimarina brevivitae TaxID=323412 RepID=A0A4Q7P069_9FLAO|nr:DUF1343 domain-containing protein [Aquimarina brevivitae]RZS93075.1 uncharacterized protein YbbC (DUF1343 family) [Aquimarina brevivitae]